MENTKHLLLTGMPGTGKTTVIRKMAERLKDYHPAGFYTEEIRDHGVRKGFRLVTLDGHQQILSHVDNRGPFRVGRYGVDVQGFERLLMELDLSRAHSDIIVIDEIGKMECLSQQFVGMMDALLGSDKTVLATVAMKGEGFIQQVKQRPDCRVVTVSNENRERLPERLLPDLLSSLKTGALGKGILS